MATERRSAMGLCVAMIWLCIALSSADRAETSKPAADEDPVVLAGAAPPKRSAAKSPASSPPSPPPSPSPSPSSPSSSPAPSPAPTKRRSKRPSKSHSPSPSPSPSPSAASPVATPATPNGGTKTRSFTPAIWVTVFFSLAFAAIV